MGELSSEQSALKFEISFSIVFFLFFSQIFGLAMSPQAQAGLKSAWTWALGTGPMGQTEEAEAAARKLAENTATKTASAAATAGAAGVAGTSAAADTATTSAAADTATTTRAGAATAAAGKAAAAAGAVGETDTVATAAATTTATKTATTTATAAADKSAEWKGLVGQAAGVVSDMVELFMHTKEQKRQGELGAVLKVQVCFSSLTNFQAGQADARAGRHRRGKPTKEASTKSSREKLINSIRSSGLSRPTTESRVAINMAVNFLCNDF